MSYAKMLVSLADMLDMEGKPEKADLVDKEFQEFLELLENGDLEFDFTFSGGARIPTQYSNPGRGPTYTYGIPGPQ